MKKLLIITSIVISILAFGQDTYSQCNDTLAFKVFQFDRLIMKGFSLTNLDGLTVLTADSNVQSELMIAVSLINVGEKSYAKKNDTIGIRIALKTANESDIIRDMYCKTDFSKDWVSGDTNGFIDNNSSFKLSHLKKGVYTFTASVIYTSKDGYFCDSIVELSSKTVTFYVDTKAPVQQVAQETSLNVFPNPARERINVECEAEMRRVTLCNALGQQVLRVNPNAPQAELQVAGLPRGLYLLRVETVGGTAVRKVVVR